MKQLQCADLNADGAFESMRSYNGRVFELNAHLMRLEASLKGLGLDRSFDKGSAARLIEKNLKEWCGAERSEAKPPRRGKIRAPHGGAIADAYIRLAVSKGSADGGASSKRGDGKNRIWLIIKKAAPYPEAYYKKGISIKTACIKRNTQASLSPQVKSSNFLGGVLAKIDNLDSLEQVVLDKDGLVAECTTSNIFIVKGKAVITPSLYLGVLAGVTRLVVMQLARGLGLVVRESPFTRHELYNADEVFITNTSMGIMPVVYVDGRMIGNGKVGEITKKLRDCFARLRQGSQ